ncbi:MAG: hypothetical protein QM765_37280 [Myxococcales bacterium]
MSTQPFAIRFLRVAGETDLDSIASLEQRWAALEAGAAPRPAEPDAAAEQQDEPPSPAKAA